MGVLYNAAIAEKEQKRNVLIQRLREMGINISRANRKGASKLEYKKGKESER